MAILRPDLVGHTIEDLNDARVYLIDMDYLTGPNPVVGVRRWLPDPTTAGQLFGNKWPTDKVIDAANITPGPDVSVGAFLATPREGGGAIYFMDEGRGRHVTSPAKMDQYGFDWDKVVKIPQVVIDWLPKGPDI
jgi:hypothetical protein